MTKNCATEFDHYGSLHILPRGVAGYAIAQGIACKTFYIDEDTIDLLRLCNEKRPGGRNFFSTLKGKMLNDRYIRELVECY